MASPLDISFGSTDSTTVEKPQAKYGPFQTPPQKSVQNAFNMTPVFDGNQSTSATPKDQASSSSLPFSTVAANSPVYTSSAGKAAKNEVRSQADKIAKSLDKPLTTTPSSEPTITPEMKDKQNLLTLEAMSKENPGQQYVGGVPGGENKVNMAITSLGAAAGDQNKLGRTQEDVDWQKNLAANEALRTATGTTDGRPVDTSIHSDQTVTHDQTWGDTMGGVIVNGKYAGLTPSQAAQIEAAGQAQKDRFDPQIKALEEQSKQDQANALIRSGQGGGFLSSQVTGTAATSIGGTWVGAGGTLGRLQTQYNTALQNLRTAEQNAINDAKTYAITAARTGRGSDLDVAQQAQEKVNAIRGQIDATASDSVKQMKALSDIQKLERSDATETIGSLVGAGYKYEDLPKEYIQDLDKHLQAGGMPPGSAQMFFATEAKVKAAQDIKDEQDRQKAEIDNAKGIAGILKDVPSGRSITIGGQSYMGFQKGDYMTGTETNDQGQVTAWAMDKETGTVNSTNLGYIGKTADGWSNIQTDQGWFSYNTKTRQAVPLNPSEAMTTWQKAFPDGSQSPYRNANDPMQGQCAAFCNDMYEGGRILGDSFAQKEGALSKYKVDTKDVQVGDTFLMSAGTTGHVGFISGVHQGPDGKTIVSCLESNYIPPGGRKISTTRTMSIDDPKLKMIARVPTRADRLPPAGPDSAFTSMAYGGLTVGGKPITQAIGGEDATKWANGLQTGALKVSDIPQDLRADAIIAAQQQGWKAKPEDGDAATFGAELAAGRMKMSEIPSALRADAIKEAKKSREHAFVDWKSSQPDTEGKSDQELRDEFNKQNASAFESEAGRVKDDKYLTDANKLADDYRAESKDFITQRNAYQNAKSVNVNTTNPQDDISLVYSFMKVVDPTSVVRESEFNTAAKASSILDQFNIKLGKVQTGQILNPKVREQIKKTMEDRFKNAEKNQQRIVDSYSKRAKGYRIDPSDVIMDYGMEETTNPAQAVNKETPQPKQGVSGTQMTSFSSPKNLPPPPKGEIWVRDKSGSLGSIDENEFDSSLYTKV